ncbi:hypothetical protein RB195_018987 [Necator americanus]|uniref:Uncharacterized protein n=1 Tax=Necator americanus TaxID=51031 RepID=A0ABR1CER9_NECAM
MLLASNTPDECRVMKMEERLYLKRNAVLAREDNKARAPPIPWFKIVTNKAFIAHLVATWILTNVVTIMMVYLPTYFKDVLLLGIVMNGTFTSLPMMFNFIFKLSWGVLMDKLKKRKILTRTLGVKISHNVWGGARSHPCGPVRHMPRTGSRALPILSQQHVSRSSHKGSIEEWNNLFLLTALMCIFSGVIFAIFGSGDLQEFAKSRKENMAEDGNLLSPLQAGTLRADSVSML